MSSNRIQSLVIAFSFVFATSSLLPRESYPEIILRRESCSKHESTTTPSPTKRDERTPCRSHRAVVQHDVVCGLQPLFTKLNINPSTRASPTTTLSGRGPSLQDTVGPAIRFCSGFLRTHLSVLRRKRESRENKGRNLFDRFLIISHF